MREPCLLAGSFAWQANPVTLEIKTPRPKTGRFEKQLFGLTYFPPERSTGLGISMSAGTKKVKR
jgi:hypothetical protein